MSLNSTAHKMLHYHRIWEAWGKKWDCSPPNSLSLTHETQVSRFTFVTHPFLSSSHCFHVSISQEQEQVVKFPSISKTNLKLRNENDRTFFSLNQQCKPAGLFCKNITPSRHFTGWFAYGARWFFFSLFQSTQVNIQHSAKLHPLAEERFQNVFLLIVYLNLFVHNFGDRQRWIVRTKLFQRFFGGGTGCSWRVVI